MRGDEMDKDRRHRTAQHGYKVELLGVATALRLCDRKYRHCLFFLVMLPAILFALAALVWALRH